MPGHQRRRKKKTNYKKRSFLEKKAARGLAQHLDEGVFVQGGANGTLGYQLLRDGFETGG